MTRKAQKQITEIRERLKKSESMRHADFALATAEAWGRHLWDYLNRLEDSLDELRERVENLED